MTKCTRWTQDEMMTLAAKGAGRIDLWGARGATLVSQDEVEAMAGALAVLGLRVIHPPMLDGPQDTAPRRPLRGPADG